MTTIPEPAQRLATAGRLAPRLFLHRPRPSLSFDRSGIPPCRPAYRPRPRLSSHAAAPPQVPHPIPDRVPARRFHRPRDFAALTDRVRPFIRWKPSVTRQSQLHRPHRAGSGGSGGDALGPVRSRPREARGPGWSCRQPVGRARRPAAGRCRLRPTAPGGPEGVARGAAGTGSRPGEPASGPTSRGHGAQGLRCWLPAPTLGGRRRAARSPKDDCRWR